MQAKSLAYWGKARPRPESEARYHPAAYHSLDVASVAAQWLSSDEPLLSAMARQSGVSPSQARVWILFFVALHDLGKWDFRFQLKAPETATSILPLFSQAAPGESRGFDHGRAGLAWFVRETDQYGFNGAEVDNLAEWMHAAACHHGSRLMIDGFNPHPPAAPEVIRHDAEARSEWVRWAKRQFLGPFGEQAARPPALPPLMAGFCSVCDWLGSNEEYFPYSAPNLSCEDYFEESCRRAERAFSESGLWKPSRRPGGMEAVYPNFQPRSVQCLVGDLPLQPGLTIVEAPTGSGKTEAALAYASRLLANGLASSIIFALPTQATANAMLERLDQDAPRIFNGSHHGVNLVLAHGKARFNPLLQSLQDSRQPIGRGPQGREEAASQCARWLAQSRKRVFLGQVGVCTIDQVLLSVLPMRHNFVRSFGVGKSVLILDEVHAYDAYMRGLLDEVLDLQRKAQGSVILLSATLPAATAARWMGQPAVPRPLPPYPLVQFVGSAASERFELPTDQHADQPTRRVRMDLRICPDALPDEEQLKEVVAWAEAGGRVAMICNLVADAQHIYRRLQELFSGKLDLFHSRFRFCDRQQIEQRVIQDCKKTQGGARILVATQVIEQSLDLDFDAMWSQLCPVDLVFQRLGRLHRHDTRQRPQNLRQPRSLIAASAGNDFGLHQLIYPDARLLWRTREMIQRHGMAEFPAAYRNWIEPVYADEPWGDEPDEIVEAHLAAAAEQQGTYFAARQIAQAGTRPLEDNDANARLFTRDGEMRLDVVPVLEDGIRLLDGSSIEDANPLLSAERLSSNSVPVPASWEESLPAVGDDGFWRLPMRPRREGDWAWEGNGVRITYSREYGMEKDP